MSMNRIPNRRIDMASRPDGIPAVSDFKLEEIEQPDLLEGQVLEKNRTDIVEDVGRCKRRHASADW
jgi:NADPH-dependent curcumin reductase CurA